MSTLDFLLDVDEPERQARLRELKALCLLYFGGAHPVTAALGRAIGDPRCIPHALRLIDALPALRRRRLLGAYTALLPGGPRR